MFIGESYIRIGYNDICRVLCSIGKPHSGSSAAVHDDLFDWRVEMKLPSLPANQLHKRIHQCTGSAHDVMDPPLSLQIMDHGVDGGSVKRVAAYQQRMKREAAA